MTRRTSVCALAVAALAAGLVSAAPASAATTITVRPGQSIQAAVNAAHYGTTIVLKPGVYRQSVLIRKDGITLRGAGASTKGTTLAAPTHQPATLCTQATGGSGVCVIGQFDRHFNITRYVRNVRITGIRFTGYPSMGVVALGADNLVLDNNAAYNNGEYGFARFDSKNGAIIHNKAAGSGEAGIYVGDSPHANVFVAANEVWDNLDGFFIRHSRYVTLEFNDVHGNCNGVSVIDDGQPGGVGNVLVFDNFVHANNKFCPPTDETPPLSGGGILLLGATDSKVLQNQVLNNRGSQVNSGGIVLLSAKRLTGGHNPSGNLVKNNTAYGNRPADIRWDGTGSNNTFARNHCTRSIPGGLCH